MLLDAEAKPCQSRPVKSCGPSGSQDLAFQGDRPPPSTEGTSRNGWQPTADALLTIQARAQLVATHGNGFRVFSLVSAVPICK